MLLVRGPREGRGAAAQPVQDEAHADKPRMLICDTHQDRNEGRCLLKDFLSCRLSVTLSPSCRIPVTAGQGGRHTWLLGAAGRGARRVFLSVKRVLWGNVLGVTKCS